MRNSLRSWLPAFGLLLCFSVAGQEHRQRFEDFSRDPQWESYRSRLMPGSVPITRQDFGLRDNAIGGWVQRSITPAWYAKIIPLRTLNEPLSASGKFSVTNDAGSSGLLFGWFHETSRGWRTPNSLTFRIDGNGGKYWVFYEYGTRDWLTGGGGCFEGDRYQTTLTKPFPADGTVHDWSLTYDPEGAEGLGLMTFVLDGKTYRQPLLPGHKQNGAEFNRFGIFNLQTTGDGLEAYFSELFLDGTKVDLSDPAGWEGRGNQAEFQDRHMRPFHNFGWTRTSRAGAKPGEVGGIVWRDEAPAYYAGRTEPLTLENELVASGKLAFHGAGSDSAVYLGWFDSRSKTNQLVSDHEQAPRNLLAVLIEGPSQVGHYFRAAYRSRDGQGEIQNAGPIIRPDGRVHEWSIRYLPQGANGQGTITVKLDEESTTLKLKPEHRKAGANFDRFGLFNLQVGGHFIDLGVDDVSYTAR